MRRGSPAAECWAFPTLTQQLPIWRPECVNKWVCGLQARPVWLHFIKPTCYSSGMFYHLHYRNLTKMMRRMRYWRQSLRTSQRMREGTKTGTEDDGAEILRIRPTHRGASLPQSRSHRMLFCTMIVQFGAWLYWPEVIVLYFARSTGQVHPDRPNVHDRHLQPARQGSPGHGHLTASTRRKRRANTDSTPDGRRSLAC